MGLYWPLAQLMQAAELVEDRTGLKVPAGHDEHDAADDSEKVPVPQG